MDLVSTRYLVGGTALFLLLAASILVVVAKLTAKYLSDDQQLRAGGDGIAASRRGPPVPESTRHSTKNELSELIDHYQETRQQINRHRNILVVIITLVAVVIVLAVIARILLAIVSQISNSPEWISFSKDSGFWLSTIGVGAIIQAFAATLLYSLHSFAKQATYSFGVLSKIYTTKFAIALIDQLPVNSEECAKREQTKLELIRALPIQDFHGTSSEPVNVINLGEKTQSAPESRSSH